MKIRFKLVDVPAETYQSESVRINQSTIHTTKSSVKQVIFKSTKIIS